MPTNTRSIDLSSMLASVLHETKNSLGHVILLLDQAKPSMATSTAETTCRRISNLLTQFLLIYRASISDKSSFELNVDACDPVGLIENISCEMGILTRGKPRLQTRLDHAPDCVFLDSHLVEMVLFDAVHNALANAKETVCLGVEMLEDGRVAFFVEDDGEGYPPDILSREPGTFSSDSRSTGLGLYFADAVAAAHSVKDGAQGCVYLSSSSIGGARFTLALPECSFCSSCKTEMA